MQYQMPTNGDGTIIDANCLINASLKHGDRKLHHPHCDSLHNFVGICCAHSYTIAYYPNIEGEARANLSNAVWQLSERKNVTNYYVVRAYSKSAEKNLNSLLPMLIKLEDKSEPSEIQSIKQEFKQHIDTLIQSREYSGKGVPGDVDCSVICSIRKESWMRPFILSDDGHFTHPQHFPFIEKTYGIIIIPANDLGTRINYSNWPAE